MKCPKCGKKLPKHTERCPRCNTKIGEFKDFPAGDTKTRNRQFWKKWNPVLSITLAVLIVLGILITMVECVWFPRKVKAPNGDWIRMRGEQPVVTEMKAFNSNLSTLFMFY